MENFACNFTRKFVSDDNTFKQLYFSKISYIKLFAGAYLILLSFLVYSFLVFGDHFLEEMQILLNVIEEYY